MAGYRDHFFLAAFVGFGLGCAGHLFLGIDGANAVLGGLFTLLGGLLPDIDSNTSTSLRKISELAALFGTIALLVHMPGLVESPSLLIVVVLGLYLGLQKAIPALLRRFTVHRGVMHSIPAIVIAGEVVFLSCRWTDLDTRAFLAGAIMVGVLVHLLADEWAGRGKRSSGTALSLGTSGWGTTLVAYLLLFTLGWWIWHNDLFPPP